MNQYTTESRETSLEGGGNMPWGVHSEFTDDEGPEVEIDEEQEGVDRTEEGSETTEDFDIDDAIENLNQD